MAKEQRGYSDHHLEFVGHECILSLYRRLQANSTAKAIESKSDGSLDVVHGIAVSHWRLAGRYKSWKVQGDSLQHVDYVDGYGTSYTSRTAINYGGC